jgi:hypothetical protein
VAVVPESSRATAHAVARVRVMGWRSHQLFGLNGAAIPLRARPISRP